MSKKNLSQGITSKEFVSKLELIEGKVERIEQKVSNKADEIVTLQILEHRRELEEIFSEMKKLDQHLEQIESKLSEVELTQQKLQSELAAPLNRKHKIQKKSSKKVTPLFT
mgnify:CR=1 FL=1